MAVPFGFSVGDFLALGKLIEQIAVELRENNGAAPEYQSLLIELEALDRALCKLQTLKPAKHELSQLTSIRATAIACHRPLQDFLEKISKFESNLGTFNATAKRWAGLPRRVQFRIMFKNGVKQLRSILASHVATINLLLMTQAVTSISAAEDDRTRLASSLENKILAHRGLLEDINDHVEKSTKGQREIKAQLRDQSSIIDELGKKAEKTRQQLSDQEASLQEIQIIATHSRDQGKSILAMVTDTLSLATSGLMQLRQIRQQLHMTIELCTTFTKEMRTAMLKLVELFYSLQKTLQRIESSLPARLYLPIVQFTTALGEMMALPYEMCQQWAKFAQLLRVIFLDKPGGSRVEAGMFLIMSSHGGRLLKEDVWPHAVRQGDHLFMSIVLDDFVVSAGMCPFPACQASIDDVEMENGGRTCRACDRWSVQQPLGSLQMSSGVRRGNMGILTDGGANNDTYSEGLELIDETENIELYRQVHVQMSMSGKPKVHFKDAMSYVARVKNRFADQPDKYGSFLHTLKDYQSGALDIPGLRARLVTLFAGYPDLFYQLELLLPSLYQI